MGRHEISERLVSRDSAQPRAVMLRCYLVMSQSCCFRKTHPFWAPLPQGNSVSSRKHNKMTHELENRSSEENYRAQNGYIKKAKGRGNNGTVGNPLSCRAGCIPESQGI